MGIKKAHVDMTYNHDKYYYRFSWFQLLRPMTLTGTISPVLVGTGLAAERGAVRPEVFIALLLAALLVQASTNMFNDYYDFLNGQDREKWVSPADTGASGHGPALQTIPFVSGTMLFAAVVLGAWLAFQSTFWVVLGGAVGIACGYAYSAGPRPLSSIGLGELVAAIFLGPVVTVLAYVVHGYAPDARILAVSVPFAVLIASMILANNIRDLEKDRGFRTTLAMLLGRVKAMYLLTVLITLAYLSVIMLISYRIVAWPACLAFLALPLALQLLWSFRRGAQRIEEIKGMKWAACHHWVFGLLFSCGLWLSLL